MVRPLASLTILLALACPALAQQGPSPSRSAAAQTLSESQGAAVRWDGETGTPARIRLERAAQLTGALGPSVASWLERDLAPLFEQGLATAQSRELAPLGSALILREVRDLGRGRARVVFDQHVGGVPVQDAQVCVELTRTQLGWRATHVSARYYPGLEAGLATAYASDMEGRMAEEHPDWSEGELTVHSSIEPVILVTNGQARAVFRVDPAAPAADGSHQRLFVDGVSGETLRSHKISCEAIAQGVAYRENPGDTPREALRLPGLYVNQGNNRVTTDNAGVHALAGQVSLENGLAGPLVRVFAHREDELQYMGPADFTLQFPESSTAQDEVAAFFHYMNFNQHMRATYPRFAADDALDTRYALLVRYKQNNGQPLRNAFFTPQNVTAGGESFTGYMAMGTFGQNQAARSASVVQHEYCHALYSEIVQLTGSTQAGGLNEGLSDYFPAVFHNDPVIGGWLVGGNGIRDLRVRRVFPQDGGEVHRVGWIFGGALWRARTGAEAARTGDGALIDQAVAEGVFRMRNRPDLLDARDAILAGDRAVSGGRFRVLLSDSFAEHGVGPRAQNEAPVLTRIGDQTVRAGESITFTVMTDDADNDPVEVLVSTLANSSFDPATNEFTFSPDATQVGAHSVTFTASDGAETDDETITIDVDPPAATTAPPSLGTSPISSGATANTGSAAPAASAPGGSGGGGGGGGGCSLVPTDASTPAWPAALLLALLFVARRRLAHA